MQDAHNKVEDAIQEAKDTLNLATTYGRNSVKAHIEWRKAKRKAFLRLQDEYKATNLKDIVLGEPEVVEWEAKHLLANNEFFIEKEKINILKKEIAFWQEQMKAIERGA